MLLKLLETKRKRVSNKLNWISCTFILSQGSLANLTPSQNLKSSLTGNNNVNKIKHNLPFFASGFFFKKKVIL